LFRPLVHTEEHAIPEFAMLKKVLSHHDPWSILVIIITFVLFFIALFLKGLSHDLLLEAGVFLVSLKLIMMSHKQSILSNMMEERLEEIVALLRSGSNPGSRSL
jgi:hypothetical protein